MQIFMILNINEQIIIFLIKNILFLITAWREETVFNSVLSVYISNSINRNKT